jgi:DNA transposition AAA+ family ATPase
MSEQTHQVKPGSLAALQNVMGAMELTLKLQKRGPHLPNLGVIYGRSGEGKSYATIFVQNRTGAIRVEVGESWNRRTLMRNILRECGVGDPKGSAADMVERAIELLGDQPDRPLIIDEADKLVDKGLIEMIREIAEASQVPVLLVGEELLPAKLQRYERVHNRVLAWFAAHPCDASDAKKLADVFLGGFAIDAALLEQIRLKADGRARRIVTSMHGVAEWARGAGVRDLTIASYQGGFFTGEAPQPRGKLSLVSRGRAA